MIGSNILKIRNLNKDDVYSVDRSDDGTIVISPLMPLIDIFNTLALYTDSGEICRINMSEVLINSIMEFMDKKLGISKEVDIEFREITECFPELGSLSKKGN